MRQVSDRNHTKEQKVSADRLRRQSVLIARAHTTRMFTKVKPWHAAAKTPQVLPHEAPASREESHAVAIQVDEAKENIVTLCINRGDVTAHDEW